jgi:uncharacterized protein YidB (DUF937 family)
MGLFDTLAAQAESALSNAIQGAHPGMMDEVTALIGGSGTGGLQNLIAAFRENGLGDAVASWIGTGQNHPISGEQLQAVLGNEQVQAIAQKLGLSTAVASQKLACLLPQVIDKLSPNGQLPEGHLVEQGLALLKGFGGQA